MKYRKILKKIVKLQKKALQIEKSRGIKTSPYGNYNKKL